MEKGLPIRKISEAARREKLGGAKPKISEMHYWWTRKPLVSARAAVLGAMLGDTVQSATFTQMLGIGQLKKPFEYQLGSEEKTLILKECRKIHRKHNTAEITILDPFAGAGSIPLEALRCGYTVHASDYNPVAWLLLNANLVFPRKFGKKLIKAVEEASEELALRLKEEISDIYPTSPQGQQTLGYLYAWVVKCPTCNIQTPLVNNWRLGGPRKDEVRFFLKPSIEDSQLKFTIEKGTDFPRGTNVRGKGMCIYCSSTINNEEIVSQFRSSPNEMMLVIIYRTKKTVGADFRLPTNAEIKAFKFSKKILKNREDLKEFIPNNKMQLGVIRAARYLGTWDQIFFPRQLIFLATLVKIGREIIDKYQDEEGYEFALAVGHYLACILAKLINYNSKLAGWHSKNNVVNPMVTFRTYPIVWEHFEVHPFEGKSGSLRVCIDGVIKGLKESISFSKGFTSEVITLNKSVLELSGSRIYDAIITDPPYLDDVPYPEVSDLFYVWEQKLLGQYLGSQNPLWLNVQTPRDEDLSSNHLDRTDDFVNMGLAESFKVLHCLLKDNGVLVLFYAHSKLEAWEFVVNALMKSGFQITATYPLTTENITNPITSGKASIFSSILLLARKRTTSHKGILENMEAEIEEKIYPRLEEFWISGLRHADLTGAAIGPVLEVITGYEELKSKFGKIDVLDILQLASQHVIKFVLSKHSGKDIFFDPITAFYLYTAIENVNGKKGIVLIPYDNAHILSKSINVDLKFMENHGLIDDGGTKGRRSRVVRFLSHDMRGVVEGTTLIDAVHRTMRAYTKDGMKGMQEALKEDTHNLEEIKVVLELFARAENPPGKDGDVARKMLGLRNDLKKADKTLFDFF